MIDSVSREAQRVVESYDKKREAQQLADNARNAVNILKQSSPILVLGLGMTLVVLVGGIDLSVGSIVLLADMLMRVSFFGGNRREGGANPITMIAGIAVLILAPILGLAFVLFLPVIGFGMLFKQVLRPSVHWNSLLFTLAKPIPATETDAGNLQSYTPTIDTALVFRYDSSASGPPSEP